MSILLLERNGRVSSLKRTKHIKAKYFLIKDYYDTGEIDVNFCPTNEMWADVLTNHYKDRSSETCVHSSKTVLGIMTMTQNSNFR